MIDFDQACIKKFGLDLFSRLKCIPLKSENGHKLIATSRPWDQISLGILRHHFSEAIEILAHSDSEISSMLTQLETDSLDPLKELDQQDFSFDENDAAAALQSTQNKPLIALVDNLISQALSENATDVHVEPDEQGIKIRFRRDGMLRDHLGLPIWIQAAMISRLKVMANLDIAEKRLPQDGRIQVKWHRSEIDVRVSTLPTKYGEKVVLRLLRPLQNLQNIEKLEMPKNILETVQYYFERPQGMVFVTGPTGSGKSSTLFAGLQHILHKEINVTTIEDPIEYELERANQVQVNEKAGLTFASALRSILRQDPDVILVGEIRDRETAQIAVQASQTGHLVLSTLHTNDSVAALTRLKDLGIEPFLIGASVLGIIAQRLVRRLCPHCKTQGSPSPEQKRLIPELPEMVWHACGCPKCEHSGYLGRVAVFELLNVDEHIRDLIIGQKSESEIRNAGQFSPLMKDALKKLIEGQTSADELIRVLLTKTSLNQ